MSAPDRTETTERPWWRGTVVPSWRFRLKEDPWGRLCLQQLVHPTGGGRGRWVWIPTATNGTSDDE